MPSPIISAIAGENIPPGTAVTMKADGTVWNAIRPRKYCIALTYKPKIEGVRAGTIRQTIRPHQKREYRVGEYIQLHGWEGRPYFSEWSWRTPYYQLTAVIDCEIGWEGIYGLEFHDGTYKKWEDLDEVARLDGIDPPTGLALRDVLFKKNGLSKTEHQKFYILRW